MKLKYITILLLFVFTKVTAQNKPELPYVINSAGGYGVVNGQMHDFNLGEMVLTETFTGVPSYIFTQGFLQPYLATPPSITDIFVVNNVVTPNADGKNDFLVIEGLEKYPGNVVRIYDRAGRVVFTATDYKNTFDGKIDGRNLNEDAYYYVIDTKGSGLLRGSVSVILDNK
jgi:gliding motility-associated-like protein